MADVEVQAQVDTPLVYSSITTSFLQPFPQTLDITLASPARWMPASPLKQSFSYGSGSDNPSLQPQAGLLFVLLRNQVLFSKQQLVLQLAYPNPFETRLHNDQNLLPIYLPPIPFGFFCRFEDNLARKLPVPLDFGTD